MAAEQFVAEALPSNVSAADAMRVDDAAYAARIGLAAKPTEPTPEPVKAPDVSVSTSEPVADSPADPAETPPESSEPEVVEPEAPKVQPLTKFQVFDADGEVELPTNLKFKFKANGKEYEDLTPDKVVLLAQQGVYNHEKQQQIEAQRKEAETIKQTAALAEQKAQQLEAYYEQLFQNPEFYERAREEWAKDQTPEAQAARYRQQLAQRDQAQVQQQMVAQRQGFVQNYLVPRLSALLAENPTVNQNELIGQWSIMTAPMLVRGEVPVERLADVQALAENQLTHWVRSVHLERSAEATKKDKQVTAAKQAAVAAKRSVARVSSSAGATTTSTPQPKQYASASDWFKGTFGG